MKIRLWALLFTIILTSCNLTAIEATPTLPPPLVLDTSTPAPATPTPLSVETLLALDTPTVVFTPTSTYILASPKDQPVNCRFGPGVSYAVVGALIMGRQAEVIGKSIDTTWWYVKNPSDPSNNCWLSTDFVVVSGNWEALPDVSPPEIGVTNIQVQVEPEAVNVGCSAFPQTVNVIALVTANGPTLVTWRWETSHDGPSPEENLLFESGGTKEIKTILTVWNANDYWVNVRVLIPNDHSQGAYFKVTCTP